MTFRVGIFSLLPKTTANPRESPRIRTNPTRKRARIRRESVLFDTPIQSRTGITRREIARGLHWFVRAP